MSQPRRPDPEPLKTNDMATVLVGTGIWALALIVLLVFQPDLEQSWWVWTCVAGIVGGAFGVWFIRRKDRRAAARAAPVRAGDDERPGGDPPQGPATV
ncbi:Protein of unknown function [Sinosporangium album]|uniref:DUF2530 domain-containing protein n=1 Tax=Sinosporangium album TaxID=504805 RepID=A0A1G8CJT8_9ACTN|nr:DUF2530 domain-containing protein [Sinosporangium album]SDH45675.1 Protein of unknown function [Sinosporangium album]